MPPHDPLAVLREQNLELMQSLDEIAAPRRSGRGSQPGTQRHQSRCRRTLCRTRRASRAITPGERVEVAVSVEYEPRVPHPAELRNRPVTIAARPGRWRFNFGAGAPDRPDPSSAEDLLELVNDLLDLAKVEAGKVEVKPTVFAATDLFGALRGSLRPLLVRPSVELVFEVADDVPELATDEAKLGQILRNLISNALKFTEAGEVRVTARYIPDTGQVMFSVRDTGIGIAAKDHERIFEEFSQVDSGLQKKIRGTGLGLPLSRSLAQLIGGDIQLESVLGRGSVFTLTIPGAFRANDEERSGASTNDTSLKRVLVIDDDETFRYVIRHIIANDARHEVIEAADGGDGLRLVREELPDMIVLDLQMPNVDGFTVLQMLADNELGRTVPVIVATSLTVDAELQARLPAGTRLISKSMISRHHVTDPARRYFKGARCAVTLPGGAVVVNVDDQDAQRYVKSRDLRLAGFLVIEARNGAEALHLVDQHRPPVVFLDVHLPDINGFEVCRFIKQKCPQVMVMMTSATFTSPADRSLGLDAGADSYLVQPSEPIELVAGINALLRLHRSEEELRRLDESLEARVQARTADLAEVNANLSAEIKQRQKAEAALIQAQKMEAIGQLTGGLAHDFNNLLTAILGNLDLTRIRSGDARMQRLADSAFRAADRGSKLTSQLLAFSRIQKIATAPIDVNALIDSMHELLSQSIGANIVIKTALDPALPGRDRGCQSARTGDPQPVDQRARCNAERRNIDDQHRVLPG